MSEVMRNDLDKTTINKAPSGMIWTITFKEMDEYISKYLREQHVDGVIKSVTTIPNNNDRPIPKLASYLFMDPKSSMIGDTDANILPALRNRINTPTKITNRFKDVLSPICMRKFNKDGEEEIRVNNRDNTFYVVLDPLKVLAMMLGARPNDHVIYVIDVKRLGKNNGFVKVVKQYRTANVNIPAGNDKYENIAMKLSSRG